MDDIDFTASETLRQIDQVLKEQHTRLVLAGVGTDVHLLLDRYGLSTLVGTAAFYETYVDVVEAYRRIGLNGEEEAKVY